MILNTINRFYTLSKKIANIVWHNSIKSINKMMDKRKFLGEAKGTLKSYALYNLKCGCFEE
jgi:hypothetical protein